MIAHDASRQGPGAWPSGVYGLCLHYLLGLRMVAIGGLTVVVACTDLALRQPVPWLAIGVIVTLVGAQTGYARRRARTGAEVGEATLVAQLLFDIAAITVLVYFTGGAANPFVSLLLLPVAVAAAALAKRSTWLVAAVAVGCYTALMLVPGAGGAHGHGFTLHLWGMWLGFVLSAALVAYFVARIGEALRSRERALARARTQAMEAERLLALGTLAAGTAHELGTPLATMAVLTHELREQTDDEQLRGRLDILRAQIDRCKQTLARMAAHAGQARAEAGRRLPLPGYLHEVLGEWQRLRPEVRLLADLHGTDPAPAVLADRTVTQALLNVLNNAADASDRPIEISARWDREALRIAVRDHGPGLPAEIRAHVGEAFVTSKAPGQGMGLGLYLARTTLARLGGSIELRDAPGSGLLADIRLPLGALAAGA